MTESPFAIRGVLEGFYGKPWTHDERLDMIDFLSRHGFNTFVYTPKDDPLMRHEWRSLYVGHESDQLAELVSACQTRGLDFVYCLSPGLSIEYSSSEDRERLIAKLKAVAALGVNSFGLLLDDIPTTLLHVSDQAAYHDLADAHIDLVTDVFLRASGSGRFYVCPTQYWGRGDEDYITRLGRSIDPAIELFWTGPAICSARLDTEDAEAFARSTGRAPMYWDNYPVNDVAMVYELHVGPYQGRAADLARASAGIIANGMELVESSKIAFATIGDYLAAPESYDPESSWRNALAEVAGTDAEDYAVFADNVRSSCLAEEDAAALGHALETFFFRRQFGDAATAADELDELSTRMLTASGNLLRGQPANPQLIAEGHAWIAAFEVGALALHKVVELHRSGKLAVDAPRVLGPYLTSLRDARVRIFGDVLDMALAELTGLGPPNPNDHTITAPTQ